MDCIDLLYIHDCVNVATRGSWLWLALCSSLLAYKPKSKNVRSMTMTSADINGVPFSKTIEILCAIFTVIGIGSVIFYARVQQADIADFSESLAGTVISISCLIAFQINRFQNWRSTRR